LALQTKNRRTGILACGLAASMMLAACASPPAAPVTRPDAGQSASLDLSFRPAYLRAMKTQLATPRTSIGTRYGSVNCAPDGDLVWDDTLFRQLSQQLPKVFRRDLQQAHYPVPPAASSNIDVAYGDNAGADYVQVDVQVQDARANLCIQEEGTSGSVNMNVLWQVYSAGASTPLYESATQGSYHAPIMRQGTTAEFFTHAFSMALSKLLAERGFQEAIRQKATR
jgi:hypothetical protein